MTTRSISEFSFFPSRFQRSGDTISLVIGLLVACTIIVVDTKPAFGLADALVLTPSAPSAPRINGPRVFGVRPGHPLLYTIPTTGDAPLHFAADHLPDGITVDAMTGQITGMVTTAGKFNVTLRATNAKGSAQKEFTIVVGDQVALTPPMGWNTYYAFRLNISDSLVRKQARALVSSGLVNHGFSYISIDEGWETKPGATNPLLAGPVRDPNGVLMPNKKFSDMKDLCRELHSEGLKAGIYSSPGPLCCGGSVGSYQHEDQDAQTFADWGFDYVKYDWCSYARIAQGVRIKEYSKLLPASADEIQTLLTRAAELDAKRPRTPGDNAQMKDTNSKLDALYAKMDPAKKTQIDVAIASSPYRQFADSIAKVKRDMVFSFCQYGMNDVWEWGEKSGGNLWRTHRDIIDDWTRVTDIGFGEAGTEQFAGPGHWNDPDILQVGVENKGVPSRLTPDEQYSHVSLWCLLAAPLLVGGDLTKLDDFTLNLLTNDEVIAVDQDPLGKQASRISQNGSADVWAKDMEDGSRAVGLFNRGSAPQSIAVAWSDLHLAGNVIVRDLWRQKDLGTFADRFEAAVPSHGVLLVSVRRSTDH